MKLKLVAVLIVLFAICNTCNATDSKSKYVYKGADHLYRNSRGIWKSTQELYMAVGYKGMLKITWHSILSSPSTILKIGQNVLSDPAQVIDNIIDLNTEMEMYLFNTVISFFKNLLNFWDGETVKMFTEQIINYAKN